MLSIIFSLYFILKIVRSAEGKRNAGNTCVYFTFNKMSIVEESGNILEGEEGSKKLSELMRVGRNESKIFKPFKDDHDNYKIL